MAAASGKMASIFASGAADADAEMDEGQDEGDDMDTSGHRGGAQYPVFSSPAAALQPAPELKCPICVSLLATPGFFPCGHACCFACGSRSMQRERMCPVCRAACAPGCFKRLFAMDATTRAEALRIFHVVGTPELLDAPASSAPASSSFSFASSSSSSSEPSELELYQVRRDEGLQVREINLVKNLFVLYLTSSPRPPLSPSPADCFGPDEARQSEARDPERGTSRAHVPVPYGRRGRR